MSTSGHKENINASPTKITISMGDGTKKRFERMVRNNQTKTNPPTICPFPEAIINYII